MKPPRQTKHFSSLAAAVQCILEHTGSHAIVGAPLGIGKPNPLLNALWRHARHHPDFRLDLYTALSLAVPEAKSDLERRFLEPFVERYFAGHEPLAYLKPLMHSTVPGNIRISEFYFQPGKMLRSPQVQRWYTSSNYTHAARDMLAKGLNVLTQQVAVREVNGTKTYSLGSNTDVTLDLVQRLHEQPDSRWPLMVAMVNPSMPFMTGQAEVPAEFFDVIVDDPAHYFSQYAVPKQAIDDTDYAIGLWASGLVEDGGTLQIGIGSLGDALVAALELRHRDTTTWQAVLSDLGASSRIPSSVRKYEQLGEFVDGLYGASEMFTEGFQALRQSGILKRHVYDDEILQDLLNRRVIAETVTGETLEALLREGAIPARLDQKTFSWLRYWGIVREDVRWQDGRLQLPDGRIIPADLSDPQALQALSQNGLGDRLRHGVLLHGAFFLGSRGFYEWLHGLDDEEREKFQMVPVSFVNELYGREKLDRLQRQKARFMNTTMKVNVLGAAASDGLSNNQEVSGVGGQYNFVAMAHALRDSRSVLMLRSVREKAGQAESNVVWTYDYDTIPRHLRDIVITEYGIADLRGKSDEDCIKAMLAICDARFQAALMAKAKRYGKLDPDWQLPSHYARNTPANLRQVLQDYRQQDLFQAYPHGCDFTPLELRLIAALQWLKAHTQSLPAKARLVFQALLAGTPDESLKPYLQRMGLLEPRSLAEKASQRLLVLALLKTTGEKGSSTPEN